METQMIEADSQLIRERAKNRAAGLYRLAFLMTGDRTRSLDVTLEAIDSGDGADSFFSSWMLAWSQRLVIAKALAGIRDELAASARRTASLRNKNLGLPSRKLLFNAESDGTRTQIESALLAIDVFPRCALLLTVFEGMSQDDTATLLNVDRDLVRKARIIGLQELTRNLARMQGWTYSVSRCCLRTTELQHV
jgi:DNA-directed RNA polymerase specialized sigma24 family protein